MSHECTRFLKRLRRRYDRLNDGNTEPDCRGVRYLLVFERHKSGMLHCHALIHVNGDLRYRDIKAAWNAGFMDAKLCDLRSAGYVTKYATKDLTDASTGKVPRIRASRNPTYGGWVVNRNEEELQEMLAARPKEDINQVWEKNLKMILRNQKHRKGQSAAMMLKEIAMSRQSEYNQKR